MEPRHPPAGSGTWSGTDKQHLVQLVRDQLVHTADGDLDDDDWKEIASKLFLTIGRLRTFKACKRHYYRHRPSTLKVAPSTAIEKSNALQALKSRRRTRLEYRANPTGGVDPQRKPVREPSASNDPANDPSLPVPVSGSAVHQDNLPSVGDDNFDFYGERLQELQKENKDHLERIRNLNNQFDEAKVQHNRMHAKLMSDIAALKRQFDMDIGSLLGGQRVPLNLEYMKEADDWQKTEAAIENFGIAFEDLHGYPSPWPILNDV